MPCAGRRPLLERPGARHGRLRQPSGPGGLRSRHLSLARLPGTGRPGHSGRSRCRGPAARPGRCCPDRPRLAPEPGTAAGARQGRPPCSGGSHPGPRYASRVPVTGPNGRRGWLPGPGRYRSGRLRRPRRLGAGASGRPVRWPGRGCWCSRLGQGHWCSRPARWLGRGCRCSWPGRWLDRECWCSRSRRRQGRCSRVRPPGCGCRRCSRLCWRQGRRSRGRPPGSGSCRSGLWCRRRGREVGADDCLDRRQGRGRRCGRLGRHRARAMSADDRRGPLPGAGHLAAGHPHPIRTAGPGPAGCPRPPGARQHALPGQPRRWPPRPRGGCRGIPRAARRTPESRIPPPQRRESRRRRGHSARRYRPGPAGPDRPALPDSPWRERILLRGSHSAVRHFPLS
jgi:hypothetical protein